MQYVHAWPQLPELHAKRPDNGLPDQTVALKSTMHSGNGTAQAAAQLRQSALTAVARLRHVSMRHMCAAVLCSLTTHLERRLAMGYPSHRLPRAPRMPCQSSRASDQGPHGLIGQPFQGLRLLEGLLNRYKKLTGVLERQMRPREQCSKPDYRSAQRLFLAQQPGNARQRLGA